MAPPAEPTSKALVARHLTLPQGWTDQSLLDLERVMRRSWGFREDSESVGSLGAEGGSA